MINEANTLDLDDLDDYQDVEIDPQEPQEPEPQEPQEPQEPNDEFDLTRELLTRQGISDINKIKFEEIRNTDLQRSLPYSVVGWFDYHFVEIEIELYVGEISVNITNNDGDSIIYESKCLCNNENFIIDISPLPSGLYIVYITINNTLYYGEITIE